MDGAGGVGELAWVTLHTASDPASGTHFTCYDGNGNIVALVSATTGDVTARYEYGPFGEPIRITGPAAGQNPFRFSTKRTDPTTDLVLYEYRVYSPGLGRWVSRDPIGEYGGINLGGFVGNSPIGRCDPFGVTSVGQILDEYFSPFSRPRTWIMGPDDAYTRIVRRWQPVVDAVNAAKADLRANCEVWSERHLTSPNWSPKTALNGSPDPNAWPRGVPSPPGTDPETAARNFIIYLLTGYQTDELHTSAIGSFALYVTVDRIDCCAKRATLKIWMYNRMSRQSFGRFANQFPFNLSGQANQDMWWGWTEDYSWGPVSPPDKMPRRGRW